MPNAGMSPAHRRRHVAPPATTCKHDCIVLRADDGMESAEMKENPVTLGEDWKLQVRYGTVLLPRKFQDGGRSIQLGTL